MNLPRHRQHKAGVSYHGIKTEQARPSDKLDSQNENHKSANGEYSSPLDSFSMFEQENKRQFERGFLHGCIVASGMFALIWLVIFSFDFGICL